MEIVPNILFVVALAAGIGYFSANVRKLMRNIRLGKTVRVDGPVSQRWI